MSDQFWPACVEFFYSSASTGTPEGIRLSSEIEKILAENNRLRAENERLRAFWDWSREADKLQFESDMKAWKEQGRIL